jgi:hypothetical protein
LINGGKQRAGRRVGVQSAVYGTGEMGVEIKALRGSGLRGRILGMIEGHGILLAREWRKQFNRNTAAP